MATTFGNRPEDVVADSRGNVLSGVVLQLYPTEADALAQSASVGQATTDETGSWPFTDSGSRSLLWVRDPSGRVWPVGSEEALGSVALKQDVATLAADISAAARPSGKHGLTRRFYATAYGAVPTLSDATTQANNTVAIQAMMDAIATAGGGVGVLDGQFYSSGTLIFRSNDVVLEGQQGDSLVQFVYTGTGIAFDTDPAAVRRRNGIRDLRIYCITAGSTALRLWNSYRGVFENVRFVANEGTTSIGVDFKGSRAVGFETSTYFNTFTNCDFLGSYASIRMGDDINRNRFFGGVVEGDGYCVLSDGLLYNSGTNMWHAVAFQTDSVNSSGVLIKFGDAASAAQVSYNWIMGCSFESFVAGRSITFATNATNNTLLGGSVDADISISGADYAANNNLVLYTSGSVTRHAFPKEVAAPALRVAGGTASEIQIQSNAIKATGTGANQNLLIASKGAASVRFNSQTNDADRGIAAYTGGATPLVRAYIGWGNDVLRGLNDSGQDTLRIQGSSGKIYWPDPSTGTLDTELSRTSANVLATGADDVIKTGRNTTANRPTAASAGAGSMFYDTTLSKPIWSDGTNWKDAAGTTV